MEVTNYLLSGMILQVVAGVILQVSHEKKGPSDTTSMSHPGCFFERDPVTMVYEIIPTYMCRISSPIP